MAFFCLQTDLVLPLMCFVAASALCHSGVSRMGSEGMLMHQLTHLTALSAATKTSECNCLE